MSKREDENYDYGYLDEAFDDAKADQDLQNARKASNRGCLIVVILVIVAIILVLFASCGISIFIGSDLSV